MAIEKPKYKLIKKSGSFEIRDYSGYITASVKLKAESHNQAVNSGFGYIADYIFGNNRKADKIAMTVPVNTERIGSEKIAMTVPVNTELQGDSYTISFIMPSKYKLSELPIPNNKSITLKETKRHLAAALKFSGYVSETKINKKVLELKKFIQKVNFKPIGTYTVARFNPPWVPGVLRHNEILFKIKSSNG